MPAASLTQTPSRVSAAHRAIAAVFFCNGLGFASWVSRIPAVRDGIGLGEGELGTALFALAAGAIVAFRLSAKGADILGTRMQLLLAAGKQPPRPDF